MPETIKNLSAGKLFPCGNVGAQVQKPFFPCTQQKKDPTMKDTLFMFISGLFAAANAQATPVELELSLVIDVSVFLLPNTTSRWTATPLPSEMRQ